MLINQPPELYSAPNQQVEEHIVQDDRRIRIAIDPHQGQGEESKSEGIKTGLIMPGPSGSTIVVIFESDSAGVLNNADNAHLDGGYVPPQPDTEPNWNATIRRNMRQGGPKADSEWPRNRSNIEPIMYFKQGNRTICWRT